METTANDAVPPQKSVAALLTECGPLGDSVSVFSRLLFFTILITAILVCGPILFLMLRQEQLPFVAKGIIAAVGLAIGFAGPVAIWLLLRHPAKTAALYLRSFKSDADPGRVRSLLKAAVGSQIRICGIRAPRYRVWLIWRALFSYAAVLRYIGTEKFELEAADRNWMARLFASMMRSQFVFIDVRQTTRHVADEIRLAVMAMGLPRCIFIVDSGRPDDEWQDFIGEAAALTPDDRPAVCLLRYDHSEAAANPLNFVTAAREAIRMIPADAPAHSPAALAYVQEHVSSAHWKTPFWERDWGQFIFMALIIGFTIQLLIFVLAPLRLYILGVELMLFLAGIVATIVCFFFALNRAWQQANLEVPLRAPKMWNPKIRLRVARWLMILAVVAYPLLTLANYKLAQALKVGRSVRARADIQSLNTQLKLYESLSGFYPSTEQGLQALVTRPTVDPQPERWFQLTPEVPADSWNHKYIYRNPGLRNPNGYDLFSAGPDGIPDTADDDWGQ